MYQHIIKTQGFGACVPPHVSQLSAVVLHHTTRTTSRCCGGYAVRRQTSAAVHTRCGRVECLPLPGWSGGAVSGGGVEGGGGEWERTGGGTPTAILHTTSMSTLLHDAPFLRG